MILEKLKTYFEDSFTMTANAFDPSSIDVKKERLLEVLLFLKQSGYAVLIDLSAVDYITPEIRTQVIYFLHHPENYSRVNVSVWIKRDEPLPSATSLWKGANWYERELYDLFGVHFDNHPGLTRILMPDDWKGHPLQKDYPLTEEPVAFKHGVEPKVPSNIIQIRREQKY